MKLYTNNLRLLSILVSLILLLAVLLPGCTNSSTTPAEITDDLLIRIESDYKDHLKYAYNADDPVRLECYYGIFDGCVPVMFHESTLFWERNVEIRGVVFHYIDNREILVWKNGVFHSLDEAMDLDLLSQSQLIEIASLHNNGEYTNVDIR